MYSIILLSFWGEYSLYFFFNYEYSSPQDAVERVEHHKKYDPKMRIRVHHTQLILYRIRRITIMTFFGYEQQRC